jgi:hypothetical protein
MVMTCIAIESPHGGLAVWRFYVLSLDEQIWTSRCDYLPGTPDPAQTLLIHGPVFPFPSMG